MEIKTEIAAYRVENFLIYIKTFLAYLSWDKLSINSYINSGILWLLTSAITKFI